ncbi:hypothetical protein D3C78_1980130 [compost metagenome]
MRRVIRNDHVDRAVLKPLNDRLHIARRAQWRVHFPVGVVEARNVLVAEHQMMGANLRRYGNTHRLG